MVSQCPRTFDNTHQDGMSQKKDARTFEKNRVTLKYLTKNNILGGINT